MGKGAKRRARLPHCGPRPIFPQCVVAKCNILQTRRGRSTMPEQKQTDPPPSEPKTSNPEEIIAVPPEILKKIKWLILYGKRHWLLVSIGAIAVVGGPLVSRYWVEPAIFVRDKLDTKLAEKTVTIAKGLRVHFRHSRETGSTDF